MKKIFFLFAIGAAFAACNNGNDGTGTGPRSTDEDTTATDVQVVENVNGNMPDTANSINLGTENTAADSSKK